MNDPPPVARRTDIVDAIGLTFAEMEGVSIAAFETDRRKQWIVERGLGIISDASRHLTEDMKARHPQIPWPKVGGIGNVLCREHSEVAHDVLWRVVHDNLGAWDHACREELSRAGAANG
jgi:uncharacterized protein with HEPN domain